MSHSVRIEARSNGPASASNATEALEQALLESLRTQVNDHITSFPSDFRSTDLNLRLDAFVVGAQEVKAAVSITGTMNDQTCNERCEHTVDIAMARGKHAAKQARTAGSVATGIATDVAAGLALGALGVVLVNSMRASGLKDDLRSRFEKGEASAEEIQLGAEAAAIELYRGLCDSVLSRLDAVVGRQEATSVSRWKTISKARWIFALVNFVGIAIAFYLRNKSHSPIGGLITGAFSLPFSFFAVHFGGIMNMPAEFFSREAAGRAAMKFSGVKTVTGVRILAVIGMLAMAGLLILIWWLAIFLRN